MKQSITLSFTLSLVLATAASAENKTYFNAEIGEVYGVADNGRYAAISDVEFIKAYLWDSENPAVFTDISFDASKTEGLPSAQRVIGTQAYDVTDAGMVVGSLRYADGHQAPAVYADGEWTPLTVLEGALNDNEAIAVTPDGRKIGGYNFLKSDVEGLPGGYFPVTWTLQDDGTYELAAACRQEDVFKYEHQGFYPMAMTSDGETICGQLFCGTSASVAAIVTGGELVLFDEVVSKSEPWIYKGKYYCGTENGKQIWSEDPEDPRIVLFTEWYIDGLKDTADESIAGYFSGCDASRYLYGSRTLISDVDEDGESATLKTQACIYDLETKEWTYSDRSKSYLCGVGTDLVFADQGNVLIDGKLRDLTEEYGIESPSPVAGINRVSGTGKVLGGCRYETNEATGDYQYFPFITVLDGAFSGVCAPGVEAAEASFVVGKGVVKVVNAASMKVFDLSGALVGEGSEVNVAPGVYLLEAGGRTAKVLVR